MKRRRYDYALFKRTNFLKVHMGGNNDQVDRYCCLCLGPRNIRAGHVACAASSVGRHDHASPLLRLIGTTAIGTTATADIGTTAIGTTAMAGTTAMESPAAMSAEPSAGTTETPPNRAGEEESGVQALLTSPADFCRARYFGRQRPSLRMTAGKDPASLSITQRSKKPPSMTRAFAVGLVSRPKLSNSRRKRCSGSTSMGCQ